MAEPEGENGTKVEVLVSFLRNLDDRFLLKKIPPCISLLASESAQS